MNKLTAEVARRDIGHLKSFQSDPKVGLSLKEEKYLQALEIALAALKAEPVHQFIVNNPDHDGYIEWADCNPDYYSKEPSDRRRILYTSPPVLKLPDELKWSHQDDVTQAEVLAWNHCLAEAKRLNGVTE